MLKKPLSEMRQISKPLEERRQIPTTKKQQKPDSEKRTEPRAGSLRQQFSRQEKLGKQIKWPTDEKIKQADPFLQDQLRPTTTTTRTRKTNRTA